MGLLCRVEWSGGVATNGKKFFWLKMMMHKFR